MQRTKPSLPFIASLVGLAVTALVPRHAHGAETNPSAWRFRSLELPATSQSFTVVKSGGHGWFVATAASGKNVRVSLPPRFGSVQREGGWVATEHLRPGDRVEVWGVERGSRYQAARGRLIDTQGAAARTARAVE
jgi:hypothetical protein